MNAYLFKIYYQFLWSYYHYRIPKQACSFKIRWLRQTRQGAYSTYYDCDTIPLPAFIHVRAYLYAGTSRSINKDSYPRNSVCLLLQKLIRCVSYPDTSYLLTVPSCLFQEALQTKINEAQQAYKVLQDHVTSVEQARARAEADKSCDSGPSLRIKIETWIGRRCFYETNLQAFLYWWNI
jgi:hypothetical protein